MRRANRTRARLEFALLSERRELISYPAPCSQCVQRAIEHHGFKIKGNL